MTGRKGGYSLPADARYARVELPLEKKDEVDRVVMIEEVEREDLRQMRIQESKNEDRGVKRRAGEECRQADTGFTPCEVEDLIRNAQRAAECEAREMTSEHLSQSWRQWVQTHVNRIFETGDVSFSAVSEVIFDILVHLQDIDERRPQPSVGSKDIFPYLSE